MLRCSLQQKARISAEQRNRFSLKQKGISAKTYLRKNLLCCQNFYKKSVMQERIYNMSYHFSKTKRFILFLIGQIVVGFGIAFTTHPGLGTSPLASFSYVTTFKIPWTFGTANIVIGFAFVLAQYIILKSWFGWKHITQIPILFVFGILVDVCMWLTKFYIPEAYFLRITEMVLGCVLLAVGVGFQLIANISMMPADGLG